MTWMFLNQNSFQQQKHDKIFMHCSLCGYKSKCPLAMERHRLSRHVHERRIQSTVSITENHKFNPSLMLPMADLSGLSLNRRNSRQVFLFSLENRNFHLCKRIERLSKNYEKQFSRKIWKFQPKVLHS